MKSTMTNEKERKQSKREREKQGKKNREKKTIKEKENGKRSKFRRKGVNK